MKDKNSINMIQNKSLELSLLLSLPATLGLLIASNQIINCLFGYGSFSNVDIANTSLALTYFAFGVPAFALLKLLSNFYFARNNTKLPFYISLIVMLINIAISVSLFQKYGFIIIPIATSISTWIGVLIYIYLLNSKKILLLKNKLMINFIKIVISTIIMVFILIFSLNRFANYLDYSYNYKAVYLISIVAFVGMFYLLSCYLLGILKLKNYKTI